MGQKVNPISLRLRVNRQQDSQWFADYNYGALFTKDLAFRDSMSKIIQIANLAPGRIIIKCLPKKFKAFPFLGEPHSPKKQRKDRQKLQKSKAFLRKSLKALSQRKKTLGKFSYLPNEFFKDLTQKNALFKASKHSKIDFFLNNNSKKIYLLPKKKQNLSKALKLYHSPQENLLDKIHNQKTKTQKKKLKSDLEAFQLLVSRLKTGSKQQRKKKFTDFTRTNKSIDNPKILLSWACQSFFHRMIKRKYFLSNEVAKQVISNFYFYRDILPFFKIKLSKWAKARRTFFLNQSIEHLESTFHNSLGTPTNIMPLKVRNPYKSAEFLANKIAKKLEKTRAYRKVLKVSYQETQKNSFVKGIRISISGRLGGAELASQQVKKLGPTSLQEFNEQIDYAASEAITKFGIIGIKVWLCFHKEVKTKKS